MAKKPKPMHDAAFVRMFYRASDCMGDQLARVQEIRAAILDMAAIHVRAKKLGPYYWDESGRPEPLASLERGTARGQPVPDIDPWSHV